MQKPVATHTLRVVWPIVDESLSEARAITAAFFQLPEFAEEHQVTIVDRPKMRVVVLDEEHQGTLCAERAVVCEAPARKRLAERRAA